MTRQNLGADQSRAAAREQDHPAPDPAPDVAEDVAVVMVSWNTRALILDALQTLYADLSASGLRASVWVVDNASADGSAEAIRAAFPQARVLFSQTNLGFAGGNNLALRALGFADHAAPNPDGPRAVFLLNPDTRIEPGALRALYDALFDLPDAGLVGARLSYEDGTFQHSAFRFPDLAQIVLDLYPVPGKNRLYESRFNGRYPRKRYAAGAPFAVDCVLGATMMLRREVIEQTGVFDDQYFMYVEEIDWCRRIRAAGWSIYSVPAAHVIHLEGRSTRQIRAQSVVNLWRSRFRYFEKHYPATRRALARLLVRGGMWLKIRQARASGATLHDQNALIDAYRKVMLL